MGQLFPMEFPPMELAKRWQDFKTQHNCYLAPGSWMPPAKQGNDAPEKTMTMVAAKHLKLESWTQPELNSFPDLRMEKVYLFVLCWSVLLGASEESSTLSMVFDAVGWKKCAPAPLRSRPGPSGPQDPGWTWMNFRPMTWFSVTGMMVHGESSPNGCMTTASFRLVNL